MLSAALGILACAAAPDPAPAGSADDEPAPAADPSPPPEPESAAPADSAPIWRPGQPAKLPDPDSDTTGAIAEADMKDDEGYGVETVHMSERAWMAEMRASLGRILGVPPEAVIFSPARQWAAAVDGPSEDEKVKGPRRYRIVAADIAGKRKRTFAAIRWPKSEEPPKKLRFLDEERLVYEALPPDEESDREGKNAGKNRRKASGKKTGSKNAKGSRSNKASKSSKPSKSSSKASSKKAPSRGKQAGAGSADTEPTFPVRLFVIQPVTGRGRAIRCQGTRAMFSPARDRLAYLVGQPHESYLAVNGKRVYPRRGKTQIESALSWSQDGTSIAFVETAKTGPRLVLVGEPSTTEGEAHWELPADTELTDARVLWRDGDQLLVRRPGGKAVFSTRVAGVGGDP